MITVYRDRDNSFGLQLKKSNTDGVLTVLTAGEMRDITKIEILFKGDYFDSTAYPDSFDWSTYEDSGIVIFRLGLLGDDIELGRDKRSELFIYDSANTNGLVWKELDIKVVDES